MIARPRTVRAAFLTPEFPTEYVDRGGLAAYLGRVTRALARLGHDPEVFTITDAEPAVQIWNDVRVESVNPKRWLAMRGIGLASTVSDMSNVRWTGRFVREAASLATIFRARHAARPFDFVQSSDYGLAGLFLASGSRPRHIVRCSWAADAYLRDEGGTRLEPWLMGTLERRTIRRADAAYAPSQALADWYRATHGITLEVIRPPVTLDPAPAPDPGFDLPDRFLLFFGHLGPRKGSDMLAEALPIAWQTVPDLTMIWAGFEARPGAMAAYRARWGNNAERVRWLGPLERPVLFAVVRRAECSVLPSRIDNLPNTALESLMLGTPVIGTTRSSLEELIDSDRAGTLVDAGDAPALANALVRAWQRTMRWQHEGFRMPAIMSEFEPARAVDRLLQIARVAA